MPAINRWIDDVVYGAKQYLTQREYQHLMTQLREMAREKGWEEQQTPKATKQYENVAEYLRPSPESTTTQPRRSIKDNQAIRPKTDSRLWDDVEAALRSIGLKKHEAAKAVEDMQADGHNFQTVESAMVEAVRYITKRR